MCRRPRTPCRTHALSVGVGTPRSVPNSIIVGLVAVIRRILVVLSGTGTVPTPQLALLIAMIFVFVAALLAVTWFERRWKSAGPADAEQEIS